MLRSLPVLVLFAMLSASMIRAQQPAAPPPVQQKPMSDMPGMNHDQPPPSAPGGQSASQPERSQGSMPGMNRQDVPMPAMQHSMSPAAHELMQQMRPQNFLQSIRRHAASGTSAEPNSTPAPMLMGMHGEWMLMFHANAFVTDTQQTSPRGGDKLFSTNWFMPMAMRRLGPGQLTLRAMLSLEPATITGRRYPLLFQQGETAYGKPIVDGQHPHDFFMELAALYDLPLGERTLLSLYFAPNGDPAIGPTAYPHRASAAENPVGTLGHHQEDSTHIASNVATVGLTHGILRFEVGGFHGREPDEGRWNIDGGAIDSWATRLTLQPGQDWSGQYSYARLHSPEALFPDEDQERMTASVMHNLPLRRGNLASTALWGRTRSLSDSSKLNSYLFESTLRFADRNYAWIRLENAGRTDELLLGEQPLPPGFHEQPLAHVGAYTFGFSRDLVSTRRLRASLGAQVTAYTVGRPLQPVYGSDPVGVSVFVRVRPWSAPR